ncbi:MAG: hypothetical protein JWO31_3576 [Phycisphaerales bacterium]|nr:hypothetical protein [Phycisphaerales bacterium]
MPAVTQLDSDPPLFLSYRGRGEPATSPAVPGPLWPALSVLPVAFCWALFASAAMPREFPLIERLGGAFGPAAAVPLVVAVWVAASLVSVAALVAYVRRPQPWHTTLCLGVHLAGLLLTLLLVTGLGLLSLA